VVAEPVVNSMEKDNFTELFKLKVHMICCYSVSISSYPVTNI